MRKRKCSIKKNKYLFRTSIETLKKKVFLIQGFDLTCVQLYF